MTMNDKAKGMELELVKSGSAEEKDIDGWGKMVRISLVGRKGRGYSMICKY